MYGSYLEQKGSGTMAGDSVPKEINLQLAKQTLCSIDGEAIMLEPHETC